MSESGDERPQQGRRRVNADEKELASQQIQIQSKRFYIDVKENQRGRFIKLAEVGVGGRKSRIMMSMSAAAELKQRLAEFAELHAQLGPSPVKKDESAGDSRGGGGGGGEDGGAGGGVIKSESIVKDRKRYYLDLKENQRGRFLRISMVLTRGPRPFLAIPAQGLLEFKDHLSDMLERYGVGFMDSDQQPGANAGGGGGGGETAGESSSLPESKSFRADNKMFYFDCGSNQRGTFVKISEVRQNRYRSAITVPDKHLEQFRDQINDILAKISVNVSTPAENQSDSASAAAAAAAPAAPVESETNKE